MGASLLFVGDIHLGRRPSRLPGDLLEDGIDPLELTPAAVWRGTVELAVQRARAGELDAVVLAGDVVESLEDRFEAYGHLADGVRALADAGLRVFGVAGNHDVAALPRLAAELPEFRLLGAGGRWERVPLHTRTGEELGLLGWSFPAPAVRESPLASLDPALARGDGATLGVLHCDLGARRSRYAPVGRGELAAAPADAWLLGHVHAPSDLSGPRPIGYLGSLQGLDPGEPGAHGPWWVRVDGPGSVSAEQIPLAPLRWERAEVELDDAVLEAGATPEDALFAEVCGAYRRIRAALGDDPARVVGCRILLRGRTRHGRAVRAFAANREAWPRQRVDGITFFAESLSEAARPALDLGELAAGSDPPALLARRLLALEREDREADRQRAVAAHAPPSQRSARADGQRSLRSARADGQRSLRSARAEAEPLLRAAAERLGAVRAASTWAALEAVGDADAAESEAALRARLLRVGWAALDELLEQRREASGS